MRVTRKLIVKWVNNFKPIFFTFIATKLLAAYLFSILEQGRSFGDGLWWCVVTATTTGYGDLYPASTAGRVMASMFMILWTFFLIPMLVANFVVKLMRDHNQFSHAEQEHLIMGMHKIAEAVNVQLPPPPSDTEHGDVK